MPEVTGRLADQVITIPNISVPGLPTPPVNIMSDNRINLEEASNVTRLTYTDTNTPAQLSAARGGLLQTLVNGVVADEVLPRANFLTMDLTLNKAAVLLQGQQSTASVRVTFLDGSSRNITLSTTGTVATQGTPTSRYRFTSKETVDLNNVVSVTYNNDMNRSPFMVPQTVAPTVASPVPVDQTGSGLSISSSVSAGVTSWNVNLTLDFGNTVFLASGQRSSAQVYVYFTDLNRWEIINAQSTVGTAATASTGFTRMNYTFSTTRPINGPNNFFWDTVPSNLTLDPAITVITTGANAPVITTAFDTSVVVPTASFVPGSVMTTRLLDQNLNTIAGTTDTVQYTTSNPNQVLYTQSVSDALNAAGRKIQLYVDGKPAGTPTTMGIDRVTLYHSVRWENQYGQQSGWDSGHSLQAGSKVTARLTVTFKSGAAPVEVEVTATGGAIVNNFWMEFSGDFVNVATGQKIDASLVSGISYKQNSISQNFPNEVYRDAYVMTSQWVDLPASAWAGETEGLKQLTAQMTTGDGSLTSVSSAPKQIRLDMAVGGIRDVALLSDAKNNGTLDAGDTLQIRFTENVSFTFSALPASFGTNATVTPVGSENGFSQIWNVRLGTGASIKAGQSFTLEARKVFDQAGNDNGSGLATPTTATLPATLMTRAGTPLIDNVSDDNVITNTSVATAVKVNLTKALVGDVVKLFMDGVEVGSRVLTASDLSSYTFSIPGSQWGADGERTLTTVITRGTVSTSSALRSVYVAADTSHWSQEAAYANKVYWFDPDAIVQAEGTAVTSWRSSVGGVLTAANTGANSGTVKIVDALTGHAYLVSDASTRFVEQRVNGKFTYLPPTLARSATDTSIPGGGVDRLFDVQAHRRGCANGV